METPTGYCNSGIMIVTTTAMVKGAEEGKERREEGGSQLKLYALQKAGSV